MAQKLGFNVKQSKGMVSYTAKYDGAVIYTTCRVSGDDKFNEELGKAMAYAKFHLLARKIEVEKADGVVYEIQRQIRSCRRSDGFNANKLWCRALIDMVEYQKRAKLYYTNQKKMLKDIRDGVFNDKKTWKEIVRAAHDKWCSQELMKRGTAMPVESVE